MLISGAMVEVSDKIDKGEVVWVPAIIIKEIDDDVDDDDEDEDEDYEEDEDSDEKKHFVKVCVNPLELRGYQEKTQQKG